VTAGAAAATEPRSVLLVEGRSDEYALAALAQRRGLDLAAHGVEVVAMGGATNIGHHLGRYGPGVRVGGLCDANEEPFFRRALERAGYGEDLHRGGLAGLGFYVCHADLEDELIRALGVAGMERVIDAQGNLRAWRTFQNQPFQRERPVTAQLRRFVGTTSGRKWTYARPMVQALDLDRTPSSLDAALAYAVGKSAGPGMRS
jgi:hypothetical protein